MPRVAERHDGQVVICWTHLQEADVVIDVPTDDARPHAVAVPELDVDGARGLGSCRRIALTRGGDDVRVREDVAVGGDHEARSLRHVCSRERVLGTEDREERNDARSALTVDRRRVEIVARKRLRLRVLVDRVVGGCRGARREEHRPRGLLRIHPAGCLRDDERRGRAQNGADHRNDG